MFRALRAPTRFAHEQAGGHVISGLRAKYDVLIVGTSSFGEGDPPEGFQDFLVALVRAAAEVRAGAPPPLKGMQHGVLGYGQSVYDTFQNTSRYVDKLLGELGSRRFVKRIELDEGEEDTAKAGEAADGEFFGT